MCQQKCRQSGERIDGASCCQLWMGNLVVYIHLWQARQQQVTPTSVAMSVSYPHPVSSENAEQSTMANRCSESFWFCCQEVGLTGYDEQAADLVGSNLLVENYLPAESPNVWPAEWSNLI